MTQRKGKLNFALSKFKDGGYSFTSFSKGLLIDTTYPTPTRNAP